MTLKIKDNPPGLLTVDCKDATGDELSGFLKGLINIFEEENRQSEEENDKRRDACKGRERKKVNIVLGRAKKRFSPKRFSPFFRFFDDRANACFKQFIRQEKKLQYVFVFNYVDLDTDNVHVTFSGVDYSDGEAFEFMVFLRRNSKNFIDGRSRIRIEGS